VIAFELVKWWLGVFIGNFSNYGKVYGTLAFLPIFMVWIYLGWTAILLGASFSASMSAFRYQPASMRLPLGYEMYGLLRLLGRFHQARAKGKGLHSSDVQQHEPMLTDSLVQQMLAQLCQIGLLSRAESGEWLLARDLEQLTLAELYEACQLRVPVAEAHLPCRDDELGHAAYAALDELRLPLRELLKRRVSSIFAELE
jgi:membrane protein